MTDTAAPRRTTAFLWGYGASWLFGWFLGALMLLLVFVTSRSWWSEARRLRIRFWWFALGMGLRMALLLAFYLYTAQAPRHGISQPSAWLALPVGVEYPTVFEVGIRDRVIRQRSTRDRDLFDRGRPLREKDAARYSVGPDGIDGALEVHYDPTNGALSVGDIEIRG